MISVKTPKILSNNLKKNRSARKRQKKSPGSMRRQSEEKKRERNGDTQELRRGSRQRKRVCINLFVGVSSGISPPTSLNKKILFNACTLLSASFFFFCFCLPPLSLYLYLSSSIQLALQSPLWLRGWLLVLGCFGGRGTFTGKKLWHGSEG